jgi:hypothetical protein
MKTFFTITLWLTVILFLTLGIANAQGSKTIVLMFTEGQQPSIARMPTFAYCGMQPLTKEDRVLDAIEYEAKGKNVYSKAIQYYREAYQSKNWNPKQMRMLVVVKNENKAFSMSGNVSANFSNSLSNSTTTTSPGQQLAKTGSDTLSSSGGVFPSYSKSWSDQKFEIWFFLVAE